MKISDEKKEIAKAYALLQKQLKPAYKDSTNPHFKSRYSSLESTWDALKDPLTDNGLSCQQEVVTSERSVSVITFVLHASGEWMEFGPLTMPVGKLDCQGFASAISYAKRYALQAAFGIVSGEDDDGNVAAQTSHPGKNEPKIHRIGPNAINELKSLMSKCSPGCEKWLLDKVFENLPDERIMENIPLNCLDFCKKGIEAYFHNEEKMRAKENAP
jgi:hypothetical protein